MTEAGTLTTAFVVETAALVPTLAPLTAVPTVVLATVTQPIKKNEVKGKMANDSNFRDFMLVLGEDKQWVVPKRDNNVGIIVGSRHHHKSDIV